MINQSGELQFECFGRHNNISSQADLTRCEEGSALIIETPNCIPGDIFVDFI